jgi:predicted XRE-type DNA-binding protein
MPKSKRTDKATNATSSWYEAGSGNIFADLGHSDEEAANLLLRSDMMIEIATIIQGRQLSQAEAAKLLGVKQPRISELMTGRIGKFKVDILVKYLNRLGVKVNLVLEHTNKVA